jgi:hypothetical protein
LAILHVIFANESIPIGFAISPSETGDAYCRLFDHILRELTRHAYSSIPPRDLPVPKTESKTVIASLRVPLTPIK